MANSDAFSSTLESRPRYRGPPPPPSSGNFPHRDGSVNRLSRVFEHDQQPASHRSYRPALPTKPPSLRISSSYANPASDSQLPNPSSESPASAAPVATSVTSFHSQEDNNNDIDQTPLAFADIRARFQQQEKLQQPAPIPKRYSHTANNRRTTSPPPVPSKRVVRKAPRPPSTEEMPRTGTFAAELSKRLEQTEIVEQEPVVATRPPSVPRRPSSSPRSSVLRKTRNNSSDSTSTSNLHIPVVARTGTGNSTTSTSSASSSLLESPSKRAWHYGTALTSWFNGQPPQAQPSLKDSITIVSKEPSEYSLPVSPQLSGNNKQNDRKIKRSKVIQELVVTEKVYQSDMLLVKQVYYDRACYGPLDKSDVKILFSNLLDILQLEDEFVDLLESYAGDGEDGSDRIGMAFRQMMSRIDHVYCEYCKRHEDAVLRLQELDGRPDVQEFFNDCREQMQGKTTSWDLGSMLIKPVQRVLKYPLLLREIFLLTPADHGDHEDLATATQEIQEVADHINEIKRRKDIVEKIVGDKKKTDINVCAFAHGINKKITRRAQRFKQVTGFSAEATQDASFDALHLRFEEQQLIAQQLARDIQAWVRQVKNHFETLRTLAENAETLYASWGGVRVKSMNSIRDFHEATAIFASVMARELDTQIQGYVYSRIDGFLKVFENPAQVINKRAQKLLDYDRVRDIKCKGDMPDKALQESADAYVSINAQLVDELPKFFQLTSSYFDILIGELASVQTSFYEQMTREWHKVVQRHYTIHDLSSDGIVAQHVASMQVIDNLIYDITPLNRELWETVPGAIPETPPHATDDSSSINGSIRSTIGSPYDNYFP
ncbi:hypothetical protein BJV82DRAFT_603659 [Fennellomyces sp. T-0311]|nr:hypothetical protein BJV82DRAFT_603659 [Fennellomyces sp. T-0311]